MTRSTLLFLTLLVAACGGRVEQVVLRGYFDLCAAADDVALENVALVALDPRRDGVVGHFRIVRVGPRDSGPAAARPRPVALSLLGQPDLPATAATLVAEDIDVLADVHRDGVVRRLPVTVGLARAETAQGNGRWIVVRLVLDGRTLPEVSSGRPLGTAP